MVSLINKQLLLTAYAYLFIMEQQKAQQGGEALQLQVETTSKEQASEIKNEAHYKHFVSPQMTPSRLKIFRDKRQLKLNGITQEETDNFFIGLPEAKRLKNALNNLPGSKALILGGGESYATCEKNERQGQERLFAQLEQGDREKFIKEAEVRKELITKLLKVQPDEGWQDIYFASPGWKDREGSDQNIFLDGCIRLEEILRQSGDMMPQKNEIRTEFTHCADQGAQRICFAKAKIQEILMNTKKDEKVRKEEVKKLAEHWRGIGAEVGTWAFAQAELQAADALKKDMFRKKVEGHADLGALLGSLEEHNDMEWARKMIEDEAIKCVDKLSDFCGREDPRSQERELKIWLAEAGRISGAVSPDQPMKGHRSMSFSQQTDFWKRKLAEAQTAQQEEQKKELKAKREAKNKICDCCTMENPPHAEECSVCDTAL